MISLYSQVIYPRLCDLLLNNPRIGKLRRELLAHASGEVLEIGFGTGLNLPHYPEQVHKITTVDPNPGMHRLAQKRVRHTKIQVDQGILSGERLPFNELSFDFAVSTFTLCSIDNVNQALSELFRVLRSGGQFLLLEHGLSPEPGVQKWQRRLNWLEMRLGDGCRLDRNMRLLVTCLPFSSIKIDEFYLSGVPRTHGYLYQGVGTK